MFVKTTLERNKELISWALYAQRIGLIKANTYVLDLDAIRANAESLAKKANETDLKLYMMTKQFGRNPLVCSAIAECGIKQAVAVSMDGARMLKDAGIAIGHLGHLKQIPEYEVDEALSMNPEVITVLDVANAEKIARHASAKHMCQDILLRVYDPKDMVYPQQGGGIELGELEKAIKIIKGLDGVRVVGFTDFPCFTMDWEKGCTVTTANYSSLLRASEIGRGCGVEILQLNAPGGNACAVFDSAAKDGITHLEPGHALTGTTYQNAVDDSITERPALVYTTEVSHNWQGRSSVFGGGFYGRAKIESAVVEDGNELKKIEALPITPGNIDYYGELDCLRPVGSGVVFAFRTQIFMTHSNVAIVSGLESGRPMLEGIFKESGQRLI